MLLAASQVAAGRMTLGDFVLVNAYLLQLALPLETIGFAVRDMAQGVVFLEKLIALLREAPEERQRVAIARVALRKPRVLVFDEATSALDSTTEGEILRNLIEISKGVTTVVVAHRLSTVVHADLIFVLDHGEITEQGTHESLLDQSGRYADMWQQQQSGHVRNSERVA